MKSLFKHAGKDLSASIVVFFVALPLCLGIALASGAPLFSGLIAGIVGGIVVGYLSGSSLGVSGPAAGLAVIVLTAIGTLGTFENFLLAVVIAGIIQLLFAVLKAGVIGYYFPSAVIKGMLAAIGIIIVLKQIPHALGHDSDYEGDLNFLQPDGENTLSALTAMMESLTPGAIFLSLISLAILILWDKVLTKKSKVFQLFPGPLAVVIFGLLFQSLIPESSFLFIDSSKLVNVPIPENVSMFIGQFSMPNFEAITDINVWTVAFTLAVVASLETLLSVEAADKLDPEKRVTPTNRELFAQGVGNVLSGLIGGLPVTQVIVRSSANVQSGGKTKLSAILHGFFLLIAVILIPTLLNKIPLAVLAAILLVVGYKLAKPALFKTMFRLGKSQFIPFIVTVIGVVFTDILVGIGLGMLVAMMFILIENYRNSHFLHIEKDADKGSHMTMTLAEELSFLNKGAILKELSRIPEGTHLELDVRKTIRMNYDVIEILEDFSSKAKERNIRIKLISNKGVVENLNSFSAFFGLTEPLNSH
ncbi:SulP family inorganic anion transporter [Algoriphagus sp. CAU 1675]|uniref:SulP family inorganic anion transporter n=1 Tax=Algoriphagus sp. CAU 1675 TaxID=3032597 RepID=UPI0023DC33E0|nr:SulP family inorganic anion transporter [Algoriphagus sp. CAU 1675]MDF2157250.1 SulP family inorganic anion transporter [Algoriphagus sp. CAU 1675]